MRKVTGFLCGTPVYEYKGWTFEYGYTSYPWPLRKDGMPFKRAGAKFWAVVDEWCALPVAERETYRVAGGCQRF